jgi:clan AA aspartic protease
MGVTTLIVKIKNPANSHKTVQHKFLVDSGAIYSVVPAKILEKLGVKKTFKQKFQLANGEIVEWDGGNVLFEYKGEERAAPVIFGEKEDIFLLGVTTLEAFGFILDPITRELKSIPMLLM